MSQHEPVPTEFAQQRDFPRSLFVPLHERVHHHDRKGTIRVPRRKRERRLTAHIDANDDCSFNLPFGKEHRQPLGLVEGSCTAGPKLALTHARPIKCDNLEVCCQVGCETVPYLQCIWVPMQQHHWRPAAEASHAHLVTLMNLECGGQHQPRSSMTQSAARIPDMAQKLTH